MPLALDVIRIQLALLVAFHAHPLPVVTLTLPVPPVLPNDADVGLTV
ncbi:MAG TPA: hypothetical protein VFO58_17920 [Vicinamibacterales bacterium]|nr:hypothetical protein [Vicinamibacterales bacterium]